MTNHFTPAAHVCVGNNYVDADVELGGLESPLQPTF